MGVIPAALLVGLTACEREPTPLDLGDDQLGVYAVLSAGDDSARVLVVRHPPDARPFVAGFEPVSGAAVHLIVPSGDTIRLQEVVDGLSVCVKGGLNLDNVEGSGCYVTALREPIQTGATYALTVDAPLLGAAYGAAVIPMEPELLEPMAGARITVTLGLDPDENELRVSWTGDSAVGRLKLILRPLSPDCAIEAFSTTPGRIQGHPAVGAQGSGTTTIVFDDEESSDVLIDSISYLCREEGALVAFDSLPARLLLAAYDTAYARYTEEVIEAGSVRRENASAGLTGAVGLFAGVAIAEREVTFVPE